jgi:hypothetical protein
MNVPWAYFALRLDKLIAESAQHLRGAIASHARENTLFHHHKGEDFVYRSPLIQYKIFADCAVIVALGEGVKPVRDVLRRISRVRLGVNLYEVLAIEENVEDREYGSSKKQTLYQFTSVWLALNEENYGRYQSASTAERKDMLRRILIGNILSMSKGLGYVVTEEIKVSRLDVYPVKEPVRLKGVRMIGFKGTFAVNFELPDYIGLGKSVSRGFGTIKRINQKVQGVKAIQDGEIV